MLKGAVNEISTVNVVSRAEWKAVEPRSREHAEGAAERVIIHHTALPEQTGHQLTLIQNMHMQHRGFDDIGYNFLLSQDGTVYEGRGWGIVGAHAKNHNSNSIGIAIMGNFNDQHPSSAALLAVQKLMNDGVVQGHLKPDFVLLGHRDVAETECPGEHLYSSLPTLRYQLKNISHFH